MAGSQDDDTARFGVEPTGDEQSPSAGTTREPLISGDPLGLGKATSPDAPSRKARPKFISLLGEFFRMSRSTAILLVAFVVVGAVYLFVRDDPVVRVGTPSGPSTSEPTATTSVTPSEATPSDQTATEATSALTSSAATSAESTQSGDTTVSIAPPPQQQQTATAVPTPGDAGQQQAPAQQQQQDSPADNSGATGSP
ncbi:hypothetical protein [Dietzia sp. ANT_WB102]|uniref:hypothetical protein n=1 Tax=Dietzia sp. ANT_WB102 TaxID=2597345 RepID=UPI0011EDDF3F|nr:hypothetical protein [Dietzia sp. ANT_WB102]KAA0917080.1 hypothetical protein FQ137_12680 [Dietzia sp. ANT_WB102]